MAAGMGSLTLSHLAGCDTGRDGKGTLLQALGTLGRTAHSDRGETLHWRGLPRKGHLSSSQGGPSLLSDLLLPLDAVLTGEDHVDLNLTTLGDGAALAGSQWPCGGSQRDLGP